MAFIFLGILFAISGKGDRDCLKEWHGSYEEMDDEKQCKELAETYGHSFKTETESGYPRSCYLNNKSVYFNKFVFKHLTFSNREYFSHIYGLVTCQRLLMLL